MPSAASPAELLLRIALELGLAFTAAVLAMLVRGWLQDVRRLSKSIATIASEVERQGRSLAAGAERFAALEKKLDRLERVLEQLEQNGCAFRKACSTQR